MIYHVAYDSTHNICDMDMKPPFDQLKSAFADLENHEPAHLYSLVEEVELTEESVHFFLKSLASKHWWGVVASIQGLARSEILIDQIIEALRPLILSDKILIATAAVKAATNYGERSASLLTEIFLLIEKNSLKANERIVPIAGHAPLIKQCVVALYTIGKEPELSFQTLKQIIDADSIPLKENDKPGTQDPKDLRAVACAALLHFPTKLEESQLIWNQGIQCYGLENLRASCFISLYKTSFHIPKYRKAMIEMVANLAYLKGGFSPEREAALYLEQMLDDPQYGMEIINRMIEPDALWVTTDWNSEDPILKIYIESDYCSEKEIKYLTKEFSSKNSIKKKRIAMLLAHSKILHPEIVKIMTKKISRLDDNALDGVIYCLEKISPENKLLQQELLRRENLAPNDQNLFIQGLKKIVHILTR